MSDRNPHAHHHDPHHGGNLAEHPDAATHGMLVVGEETVYLSHLPMFGHAQHDVQAILEVHFINDGDDPQDSYVDDRRSSGERVYTLKPERFFLHHLVTPEPEQECLCEFTGSLYRGHFEREGATRLSEVTINVDHVVHFRQFDPAAIASATLEYVLFGKGNERFLAHLITRPPDFDQIVSVRVAGSELSDDELRLGPTLSVPRRANRVTERLRPGERITATIQGETGTVEVEVGTEFYLEEGELGTTFSTKQTPEEKLAGF